jgi:hypothetical protein
MNWTSPSGYLKSMVRFSGSATVAYYSALPPRAPGSQLNASGIWRLYGHSPFAYCVTHDTLARWVQSQFGVTLPRRCNTTPCRGWVVNPPVSSRSRGLIIFHLIVRLICMCVVSLMCVSYCYEFSRRQGGAGCSYPNLFCGDNFVRGVILIPKPFAGGKKREQRGESGEGKTLLRRTVELWSRS